MPAEGQHEEQPEGGGTGPSSAGEEQAEGAPGSRLSSQGPSEPGLE